jgi:hypothetical protein
MNHWVIAWIIYTGILPVPLYALSRFMEDWSDIIAVSLLSLWLLSALLLGYYGIVVNTRTAC